jgi:hypothetical protein
MKLLLAYLVQIGLALDQLLNALIPPLDGTLSYSDETLSARSYRAWRDGKAFGALMPLIDFLFSWQKPDPEITDAAGAPITGHCARAFHKEKLRRGLPPEYR